MYIPFSLFFLALYQVDVNDNNMQCIRDVNDLHILEPRCEEDGISLMSDNSASSHDRRTKLLESAVSSICRVRNKYLLLRGYAFYVLLLTLRI